MVDVVSPLTRVPPVHTAADRAVEADPEIADLDERELVARINALRAERDAVILPHSYQIPAIQDLADFIGDSLELARQAAAPSSSLT